MEIKDIKSITERLTAAQGVSGNEFTMDEARSLLSLYGEVRQDRQGNIICETGKGKKHILLDAHLDRIGLMVTSVDETGFLRVDRCGGCDVRVLSGAEVTVWGKKNLYGVITSTPPHLSGADDREKAPSFDNLYVDTGLNYGEVSKIVSVGDRITIDAPVRSLAGSRITGAALDDRIGMAAIIRVLDILKDKNTNVKISVLFSVQEETTEAGSKTGAFGISPDEAIAVDVSFGTAPGISPVKSRELGKGGMICISPSISYKMSKELMRAAEKSGIKYQTEICPGSTGTNADAISVSKTGIKTGLVSIPIRNMHTQAEVADLEDAESTAQIIAAYILAQGEQENV